MQRTGGRPAIKFSRTKRDGTPFQKQRQCWFAEPIRPEPARQAVAATITCCGATCNFALQYVRITKFTKSNIVNFWVYTSPRNQWQLRVRPESMQVSTTTVRPVAKRRTDDDSDAETA
jgi:hypothetical protein